MLWTVVDLSLGRSLFKRSALKIFNAVADALEWIVKDLGVQQLWHRANYNSRTSAIFRATQLHGHPNCSLLRHIGRQASFTCPLSKFYLTPVLAYSCGDASSTADSGHSCGDVGSTQFTQHPLNLNYHSSVLWLVEQRR